MTEMTVQRARRTFVISVIASAVLITGSVVLPGYSAAKNLGETQVTRSVSGEGFANLIEQVEPSVVTIEVDKVMRSQPSGFSGDPRAEEFFERFFGPRGTNPSEQGRMKGAGSGFVVDEAGYIVTNNHVIADADTVSVRLHDDRQFNAEVVGTDEKTDLALLKIDADGLPATSFGDSDGTRVGEWVVAIGNPFGLGGTATAGIISARGRDIRSGPYDDFLQIDAPINRGNSGGPVFNTRGEVVGVNTAIYSPNGGSVGIGFAIPSNQVQDIVEELRNDGMVDRGWLGVQLQNIDEELADGLGLPSQQGALIADVLSDSPAEDAGIEVGDVVLAYNDRDVTNAKTLSRIAGGSDSGDRVTLKIHRDGEAIEVEVTLGSADNPLAMGGTEQKWDDLGLALSPLTDDLRSQLGVSDDVFGAVVVKIDPNGKAAKQGLQRGDILVKADRKQIKTPGDLKLAMKEAKNKGRSSVPVLIRRGDMQRFSTLPVA